MPEKSVQKAIVIIPTYNERENIEITLAHVFEAFKKVDKHWNMSVLVVDDTSPDKTYKLVKKLQKKNKKLHLLVNKKKDGLGRAYLKGMEEAFNNLGADLIFEFDADLSHDPEKIPLFLKKIDEGYDLVIGSRYVPGGGIPANWGLHRKFFSIFGNLIIRTILTNFKISDWTGGYRAIKKKVWQAVKDDLTSDEFSGYTFQTGFLHKSIEKGFKVSEVPFHFKDRVLGKSKIGPEYVKNILLYIMKARLKGILEHRIFKFVIVGGLGFLVQLTALQFLRTSFPFQLATFLSIETAIVSNFIFSNLWTFADRKLKAKQVPGKFLQFNLASAGSILIQQGIAFLGETYVGLFYLFTLPIINFKIDTGITFAITGILIGMFWNFFAYSKIVWKKKK